jgi:hypothetical protein
VRLAQSLQFVLVALAVATTAGNQPLEVLESAYSARELELDPDPTREEWTDAPRVYARTDKAGVPIAGPPTEIRSRWTREDLYLLRIGLFRIGGANPRQHYSWRPTGGITFHAPEAFGTLRLR